jgi:hypothetical protein
MVIWLYRGDCPEINRIGGFYGGPSRPYEKPYKGEREWLKKSQLHQRIEQIGK